MRSTLLHAIASAFVLLAAASCSGGGATEAGADVRLELSPSPPRVGLTTVALSLTEPDGSPLTGATVRVEGNMNHAGMVPEFADAMEAEPGLYRGELEFTMGGDWFLVVSVKDGESSFERVLDVPGVSSE